jgi:hypothetical protein
MKNVSIIFSALILFVISNSLYAQELVIPKGVQKAYGNGTRNVNGAPGENYWQNSSDYFIQVSVKNGVVTGSEKVVYSNNSPDSLGIIVIRLYQDLFKKGVNRNAIVDVDPRDINNGVNVTKVSVNNEVQDLKSKKSTVTRNGTLMYLKLKDKLAPNSNMELSIDWNFVMPKYTLIRMGTIDSTSLFVGQWYPQIAVYDDLNRWDRRSYNGLAEFYSDFSNYEVEITVPDNFMVWSTGEPQNLEEVLKPNYYTKYAIASVSNEITHVITQEDLDEQNFLTKNHTWKYKAQNVTDFAFGISDHYLWDVTSVEVDRVTKRRTVVGVAYKKDSPNFDKVAMISRASIKSLSENMPGVPYPFPYLTVYNGDFGMEYPMITNVGAEEDYGMTVYANSHEIAHGYFPFYVATNETKNGWLDESLVVFMPKEIQMELEPKMNMALYNTGVYSRYSGMEDEPAIITPTHYLNRQVYFYLNYGKAEQALRILEIELGEQVFKEALQTFMDRWKYKHPTPYDFFQTFSEVGHQDLNWYWNAWYFQAGGIPDLTIKSVNELEGKMQITIANTGDLPLPIVVAFYSGDRLVETVRKPASDWKDGEKEIQLYYNSTEKITKIVLGEPLIPDATPKNNTWVLK